MNDTKTHKSNLGLKFTDAMGRDIECWQMVNIKTGKADADMTLINGLQESFLFADRIEHEAKDWRDSILKNYTF